MKTNEILKEILKKKKGEKYDVALMYSGGKDSSYLLYLLKKVYGLRVIAVMVDNGYEKSGSISISKEYTERMNVPLKVIKTNKKNFSNLFNMLITENELFRKDGINHVCFICNNILWANVVKYAKDNDIPYVVSGLSLNQLSSGRKYPLVPSKIANSVAEKSTKMIFHNAYKSINKTAIYGGNLEFKNFIDELYIGNEVATVYPYIYHDIGVNEIKKTLSEYGWKTPNMVNYNDYISSGCTIMTYVIGELEKLGMITLNEREQAKLMIKNGQLDEKNMEFATYDATKEAVDLSHPLFEELKIKEFLKNKYNKQDS